MSDPTTAELLAALREVAASTRALAAQNSELVATNRELVRENARLAGEFAALRGAAPVIPEGPETTSERIADAASSAFGDLVLGALGAKRKKKKG